MFYSFLLLVEEKIFDEDLEKMFEVVLMIGVV